MTSRILARAFLACTVLMGAACRPDTTDGEAGHARLALVEIPADVACVEVTVAAARTITRRVSVVPSATSVYDLTGLPEGAAQISAAGFSAACAALNAATTATWISDPVATTIVRGTPVDVTVRLRRNTRTRVSLDFDPDAIEISGPDGGSGEGESCVGSVTAGKPPLQLLPVVTGLGAAVTAIVPAGSGRQLVALQNGVVRVLDNGALRPLPFLDLRSAVRNMGEQGLLGLALSPSFASDGRIYVMYSPTAPNPSVVVSRFAISADPNVAALGSATKLITITKPAANHNGGQLAFGPDSFLYVGVGDGGGGGDPMRNAQNTSLLLGKVLRLDVSGATYSVPPSNPFVSTQGARGEIWAYGLRNPWRFSFDRATGELYLADVGQNSWEELNVEPAGDAGGRNYGWNELEGSHCFSPAQGCSFAGKVLPVHEYAASGGAIIGGYVYRGCQLPGYRGTYVFGDFGDADVRGLTVVGGTATAAQTLVSSVGSAPTTFGEDTQGEIYVGTASGNVLRLSAR